MNIKYTAVQRFIKYVKIDTQSDSNSETVPSTLKQKDLSKILVQELLDIGVLDAHLDAFMPLFLLIALKASL
jgi:tripeptide aminopeptidase